jgi:protein gp37
MSGQTGIEWCEATWNLVTGCTKVSEGCRNCWACRLAATRLKNHPRYRGLATYPDLRGAVPQWTNEVRLHPDLLDQPLHWRKPRRIFVCSQADLFHEGVPGKFIDEVLVVMASASWHTFLVLTKRPKRMLDCLHNPAMGAYIWDRANRTHGPFIGEPWPLPNVWLGVSVEDQKTADERIPLLLQTPVAVRFISYEPALGSLDLRVFDNQKGLDYGVFKNCRALILDWVIAGGESGPNARPAELAWFRQVKVQCDAADVPFFMKQICDQGRKIPFDDFPTDLRVREFPGVR